jgi:hypothetical protein
MQDIKKYAKERDKEKAEAIEWLTNHGFNLDL